MKQIPEIKIESGIPIPTGGTKSTHGTTATLRKMQVGDSALFPRPKNNNFNAFARMLGIKVVTRTVENGVRVWRTA